MSRRVQGRCLLVAVTGFLSIAPRAHAYPIDCAILICLSGGWAHPSAECTVAQIEFMRRITPWPIEPPVQIWNCPLNAAFEEHGQASPMQRLYDITFPNGPTPTHDPFASPVPVAFQNDRVDVETDRLLRLIGDASGTHGDLAESNETADIDISSPTFDFLRSIKVYDIRYKIKKTDHGYCYETGVSNIGSYGIQGDFEWDEMDFDDAPNWAITDRSCPQKGKERVLNAVGIEWTDYSGVHGYDLITY